ncbi:MAG: hypothetical protein ACQCN6_04005 [Candidatus Bathyarchaeia archaeon]
MWNIPPAQKRVSEDSDLGTQGLNGMGGIGYSGPCSPRAS